MNKIVKWIQKHQDFFLKISKNNYLMAIKDGFISIMPLVMFSSLMILIVQLPTLFGIVLPDNAKLIMVKIYNLTMGIMGLMVAGTTAKALTGNFNRTMPEGKAINSTSTMIAAMSAFLFLAVSPDPKTGALDVGFLGTQGLLSAFVAAFLTVNIYKLCIKKNITIKLPKEVPGTIAQSFKDIFPFAFAVLACVLIDLTSRAVSCWCTICISLSKDINTSFKRGRNISWNVFNLWIKCAFLVCRNSWAFNCYASCNCLSIS